MDRYLDWAAIQCKAQAQKSIYVSAQGHVLPCCWLAAQLHSRGATTRAEILDHLVGLGGVGHIDGRRRGIRAIVEDRFFQELMPGSWTKPDCAAGKLRTCARVCGHDFRAFEAQTR
jgi:hypothetical protein